MMASALEFAGYDCAFDWAEGSHSVRRASEIFPETVTWLLNSPAQPKTTGNNLLAPLLIDGESWREIAKTEKYQSPKETIDYPGGGIRVHKQQSSNVLLQSVIAADSKDNYTQPFYWLHNLDGNPLTIGGMAYDNEGNLWVVTSVGLQILDQNGRVRGILRLPQSLDTEITSITIVDDAVILSDNTHTFKRNLNTSPGTTLPRSQGQG